MDVTTSIYNWTNSYFKNEYTAEATLFQNIPLPFPPDFFSKTKNMFVRFIWKNRRARLHLSFLYMLYDRGGLKYPNLMWYYCAAQLRSVMFYFSTIEPPLWTEMESNGLALPLPSYIYSYTVKTLKKQTKNPIVKHMLKIWYDV